MSSTRRKFLQTAAVTSAAVLTNSNILAQSKKTIQSIKDSPIVVSTWSFGAAANEGAWEILSTGGRALDAVEAGVKIPEADPTNQSVGLGGLPDRDKINSRLRRNHAPPMTCIEISRKES